MVDPPAGDDPAPGGEPAAGRPAGPVRRVFFLIRAGAGWRLLAPDDARIAG